MAMSNWDTYALVIHNGKVRQSDGSYKYMNWKLEIYKNWLSITDPKGKHIHYDGAGELGIGKVYVYSMKIKGDIYLACTIDGKKEYGEDDRYFVGVGAYGWKDSLLSAVLDKMADFGMIVSGRIPRKPGLKLLSKFFYKIFYYCNWAHNCFEPKYVGVTKKQVERLSKFVKSHLWKLEDIDLMSGKRICQGDLFFQGRLILNDQSTPVGEAKENLLSQWLR